MTRPAPAPAPLRVLVVGGGAAGLLHAQLVLDHARALGRQVELVWAVWREGAATASRSGGLAMPYASADPRTARWSAASPGVARALVARHRALAPYLGTTRAVVRSGPAGEQVLEESPLWHTCGLLPVWARTLAADPRVVRVDLTAPLRRTADLLALHDAHGADVTVACLGLGAHVLGDPDLHGRFGVLLTGPLPHAGVHREHAVVQDDDAEHPRYTVPHRVLGAGRGDGPRRDGPGGGDHLHVGGTFLPVDDPAVWDDPALLADRARALAPRVLAAARERFADLAGWQPYDDRPWWGIRPLRPTVAVGRLDPARTGGRRVVVDHGWGGSGWTVGPALADEVARAVLGAEVGVEVAAHGTAGPAGADPADLPTLGW